MSLPRPGSLGRRGRVKIPLGRRAQPPRRLPFGSVFVTVLVVVLGLIVLGGDDASFWYRRLGLVPARYWAEQAVVPWFWQAEHWFTPFSAVFVHLDWVHLVGNLAFFWLFAQRIERRTGWLWLLLLVAAGGVLSNLASAWKFAASNAPIIGASGATAAMLGAFLAMYPTARLGVILPLGLYLQVIQVRGLILIGSWLLIQIVYSLTGEAQAAVAWWSHVAGFLSGLILAGGGRILGVIRR